MQIDFSSNYFELFGFDTDFRVDLSELNNRWQSLQRSLHPDNFAASSDTEKRYSMQAASLINEAHKVLSSPLSRAGYLLKLNGVDLDVETDTQMSGEFLMEQMELRERIGDVNSAADPYTELDAIRTDLKQKEARLSQTFSDNYDAENMSLARDTAREWQFIDKLTREISDIEAVLDDA